MPEPNGGMMREPSRKERCASPWACSPLGAGLVPTNSGVLYTTAKYGVVGLSESLNLVFECLRPAEFLCETQKHLSK